MDFMFIILEYGQELEIVKILHLIIIQIVIS